MEKMGRGKVVNTGATEDTLAAPMPVPSVVFHVEHREGVPPYIACGRAAHGLARPLDGRDAASAAWATPNFNRRIIKHQSWQRSRREPKSA